MIGRGTHSQRTDCHESSIRLLNSPEWSIRELQHLDFQRFPPRLDLAPWVQGYWSIRCEGPDTGPLRRETLYPDGGSSLLFNLASGAERGVWFSARHVRHRLILQGAVDTVGIRFHPGGVFRLLGVSPDGLDAGRYPAAELGIPGTEQLLDRLGMEPLSRRLALIEEWLCERAAAMPPDDGLIRQVWSGLADPDVDVNPLSDRLSVSRRNLERRLRHEVGLSPHRLRMLLRIRRARTLIKLDSHRSLATVAHECGYHDQAHFIHQFEAIAGTSPGRYRERQRHRRARGELRVQAIPFDHPG